MNVVEPDVSLTLLHLCFCHLSSLYVTFLLHPIVEPGCTDRCAYAALFPPQLRNNASSPNLCLDTLQAEEKKPYDMGLYNCHDFVASSQVRVGLLGCLTRIIDHKTPQAI